MYRDRVNTKHRYSSSSAFASAAAEQNLSIGSIGYIIKEIKIVTRWRNMFDFIVNYYVILISLGVGGQ